MRPASPEFIGRPFPFPGKEKMEAVLEQPKALADAADFAEYKAIRATPQPVAKPADSPAEGDTSTSDPVIETSASNTGESASASEAGEKSQEKREKKDRTAGARISELSGKLKAAEESRAKLERELQELRNGTRKSEAAQEKPETVKTPPAATAEDGEPDFEKLLQAAVDDPANTTYEKAQAAALRAYHRDMAALAANRAAKERLESQAKTAHEGRLAKTREAHSDFDEVVAAAVPQVEGVHNTGIEAAIGTSDTAEVVYYFATHLDEFRKIAGMNPQAAYRATVALDLKLSQSAPEKPRSPPRQPSRAPAPVTPVAGSTAHTPKSPAEARDYSEYKRLRAAKA